ncbi:MAG: nucleoside triphosphate pyrophosphohydrolase [Chloroflexi bacterium]|nr:nucleoside triphosphate pyrophosphohydrolase [Chloroflexota bacterium]MCL5074253.1 nucleoside triphosphate pyrophosphohydrolase [Chloroflexota bacterium]
MARVTVIGLGPGGWEQLTLEAQQALSEAKEIYLRTRRHPVVAQFPAEWCIHSFDSLYEESESFEDVYEGIASRLLELADRLGEIVYAVPGHPLVGEESVRCLLKAAKQRGIETKVISGMSFLEPVFTLLGLDPLLEGLQIVEAMSLAAYAPSDRSGEVGREMDIASESLVSRTKRPFDPTRPALIGQLYDKRLAGLIKIVLLDLYPDGHEVQLVRWAGMEGQEEKKTIPLYALDQQEGIDHLTCLYLPPLPIEEDLASFDTFRYVVARLRGPGGCPWDRQQTHESLKPYLIEEAYEVLDALDTGDKAKLCEELGDLLLQVLLHALLAEETDDFGFKDVVSEITAKLIRRHPHVFANRVVSSAVEVVHNWEQIKRGERGVALSALSSVPKHMPALAYAQIIQRRAARVGFDWREIEGVLEKVAEELWELGKVKEAEERSDEFGDLLFALVNVARWMDIDAEESLRQANRRFYKRFQYMEKLCRERGLDLGNLNLEEQDELWEVAKRLA